MFKQPLSLFLAACLVFQNFQISLAYQKPGSASPVKSPSLQPSRVEEALSISDSLFDGKKAKRQTHRQLVVSSGNPPPECQQDPSQCEVTTEQVVDADSIERTNEARGWWHEEDKKCKEADKPGCAGQMPSYFDYMSAQTNYRVKRKPQEQGNSTVTENTGNSSRKRSSSSSSGSFYDDISSMSELEILGNFLFFGSLFGLSLGLGAGWINASDTLQGLGQLLAIVTAPRAVLLALHATPIVIREALSLAAGLLIAPPLAIRDSFLPNNRVQARGIFRAMGPLPSLVYWATRASLMLGSLAYFPALGLGYLSHLPVLAQIGGGIASGGILTAKIALSLGGKLKDSMERSSERRIQEIKELKERQKLLFSEKQDYLKTNNINLDSQESHLKTLRDSLGNNLWDHLYEDPDKILGDAPKAGMLRQALKNLDLRYLIAERQFIVPLGKQNTDIGKLLTDNSDQGIIGNPPITVPAKLTIRKEDNKQPQCFHQFRYDPKSKTYFYHDGLDLKAHWGKKKDGFGVPVGLPREVVVVEAVYQEKAGNYIIVQDKQKPNVFYMLAHAGKDDQPGHKAKSGILVKDGETIPAHRALIVIGDSGNADDPHLHLEKFVLSREKMGKVSKFVGEIRDFLAQEKYEEAKTKQRELRNILFEKESSPDKLKHDGKPIKPYKKYAVNPLDQ